MTIDDVNNDDYVNGYDVTTTMTMWLLIMSRKSERVIIYMLISILHFVQYKKFSYYKYYYYYSHDYY